MSQPEMPESVTDGDTPEDLLIDATDHPDVLDSDLSPTTVDGSYDAGQITVLEGLEAVRKRPGMYIGSTGERGLHHCVYEIVDNSVDEAMAGYCDTIQVELLDDNWCQVTDNGRGIPVKEHPVEHIPTVTLVLTKLHAGGKFGNGGYKVSGGLHGVGSSVVNALASHFVVEVRRDGYHWRQSFSLGEPDGPLEQLEALGPDEHEGTTVRFQPSDEIFDSIVFEYETLSNRFREMAFLNKGLRIMLTDRREGHVDEDGNPIHEDFLYNEGLKDYVRFLTGTRDVINPTIISLESHRPEEGMGLEIAMQWNTSYTTSVHTFANAINTIEGGAHEEGFRAALTNTVNRWGETWGLIKKREDRVSGDDIREGLTAVVSIKLTEPQFEGQTKTKLGNTEARTFVAQQVYSKLTDWFDAHPADAKAIINKGQAAQAARVAARKAREATRRKGVLESASMPGKLRDCSSRTPSECEIFIVEGDSAGGSAVGGRDPERQAILPIRGKILNVEKARLDRALSSDTIRSLITAFGTGIGEDFDISKLRYGKIVIMADADVDGQHIATLLLTLLFRYMRPLIEDGHTFIAMPPLYRIKWTNAEHEFAYSDKERDKLLAAGAAANRRLPKEGGIQRYKGLGEMNDHELWETTMDPERRILKQVTLDEAADADETFTILMGDDVDRRRTFIQRNASDVRFLDI